MCWLEAGWAFYYNKMADCQRVYNSVQSADISDPVFLLTDCVGVLLWRSWRVELVSPRRDRMNWLSYDVLVTFCLFLLSVKCQFIRSFTLKVIIYFFLSSSPCVSHHALLSFIRPVLLKVVIPPAIELSSWLMSSSLPGSMGSVSFLKAFILNLTLGDEDLSGVDMYVCILSVHVSLNSVCWLTEVSGS